MRLCWLLTLPLGLAMDTSGASDLHQPSWVVDTCLSQPCLPQLWTCKMQTLTAGAHQRDYLQMSNFNKLWSATNLLFYASAVLGPEGLGLLIYWLIFFGIHILLAHFGLHSSEWYFATTERVS